MMGLTAFQNQSSNLYQATTTTLAVEQQTMLMEVVTMAESQASNS